jgi:hypothetical protein
LTRQSLEQLINETKPTEQHPINDLILASDLEDAAQSGYRGVQRLQARASRRRISSEVLRQARENASRVGRTGEEFVYSYLSNLQHEGRIEEFEWVSDDNAVSPYDFRVRIDGETVLIEVKATENAFQTPVHVSYNELLQMRDPSERYDLYRVYEISGPIAQVRVAENLREFAINVLDVLERLPEGIRSDSVSVSPEVLPFQNSFPIYLAAEEE